MWTFTQPPFRPIAAALALAGLACVAHAADDSERLSAMSDTELEAGMKSGVQVVLRRVPLQMEDQSVLVGAEYEPATRVATYHYYLQSGGVDPANLRNRLTAKNCATPNTRAMLGRGIRFRHLYIAGDRQLDVMVSGEDCARRG